MTIEEKMNLISRQSREEGRQEGHHNNMIASVNSLIINNYAKSEEEACRALNYDFDEYLLAKNRLETGRTRI